MTEPLVDLARVEEKACYRCGVRKPLGEFWKDHRRSDGREAACKTCRLSPEVKRRQAAAYYARRESDPEKSRTRWRARSRRDDVRSRQYVRIAGTPQTRARSQLYDALRRGKIVRPEKCQRCGTAGRVDGHHADHSRPLDVEWLCRRCHGIEHRKYGEAS